MIRLTPEQVERMRTLEDEGGRLTPALVVEDARHKDSPLHDLFEWDKAKAAYQYNLTQARVVIGAVVLVVKTTTATLKAPLYVRDPAVHGHEQGYRSVTALRDDPDQARESLIYTLEQAAGLIRRAVDLAQPLGLSGEIDALLEGVLGVQRSLQSAA